MKINKIIVFFLLLISINLTAQDFTIDPNVISHGEDLLHALSHDKYLYNGQSNLLQLLRRKFPNQDFSVINSAMLIIDGETYSISTNENLSSINISKYISKSIIKEKAYINCELICDCFQRQVAEIPNREIPDERDIPDESNIHHLSPLPNPGPLPPLNQIVSAEFYIENNNVVIKDFKSLYNSNDKEVSLECGFPKGGKYYLDGKEVKHLFPYNLDPGTHKLEYRLEVLGNIYKANKNFSIIRLIEKPEFDNSYNYISTKTFTSSALSSFIDIDYFDDLGRLSQSINIGASYKGNDVVSMKEYNLLGLQEKQFNPYILKSNNGRYDKNDKVNQSNYYKNNNDGVSRSLRPYSEIRYEKSPKNRIVESTMVGELYSFENKHTTKINYDFNNSNEIVKYIVNKGVLKQVGFYPSHSLFLQITHTNNWKQSDGNINTIKVYKDSEGKLIQEIRYDKVNGLTRELKTCYVYDAYCNLHIVLPPSYFSNDGLSIESKLNKYCYVYGYDDRNRMTSKKLPGVDSVLMIYDKYDRLVLQQDGNQRKNGYKVPAWTYYKYDEFNRIKEEGICTSDLKIEELSERLENFPTNLPWDTKSEVINYYDDYSFISNSSYNFQDIRKTKTKVLNNIKNVKGLLTGKKEKVFTSSGESWIITVNYYDQENKILEVVKDNYPSGKNITLNEYDYLGNVVKTHIKETNFSKTNHIEYRYTYNIRGVLLTESQSINGSSFKTLSRSVYNELGEISNKVLGSTNSIDYKYDIRGCLTELKSNVFEMGLSYGTKSSGVGNLAFTSQYTGNISAIDWKFKSPKLSGDSKVYTYSYDGISRLKSAIYGENKKQNDKYNVFLSYDLNGNIQSLQRLNNLDLIDDLSYKYNGNQLLSVSDGGDSSLGFKDGSNSSLEYTYDSNGNMISDKNKYISKIEYNSLNLPKEILVQNQRIRYMYSSSGEKLQNILASKTLTYSNGFVYENGSLSYILTSVGRYVMNGSSGKYEYNICDHLGNVRAVVDDSGELLQQNDYYPFGGVMSSFGGSDNKYLYNGKELQEGTDWLDYGARMYDGYLGRWSCVDPMAEKYKNISSYSYVANNPILLLDPDGNKIIIGNNTSKALTNLAMMAATRYGEQRINQLISSFYSYITKSTFFSFNSCYDGLGVKGDCRTIYYVGSPWMTSVGWGAMSSFYAMGHELNHAYDHETTGKVGANIVKYREQSSVNFTNYLRSVYGDGDNLRTTYFGLGLKFSDDEKIYNNKNEKITDFTQTVNISYGGNTYMGFSYNVNLQDSENQKYYILSVKLKSGEYAYRKFTNKEEYDLAVKRVNNLKSQEDEK